MHARRASSFIRRRCTRIVPRCPRRPSARRMPQVTVPRHLPPVSAVCSLYTLSSVVPAGFGFILRRARVSEYESDSDHVRYITGPGRPRQRRPPAVYRQSRISVQDRRKCLDTAQLHISRIPDSRSVVPQECHHEHHPHHHRACQPILQSCLYLLMDRKCMEVWVQGCSMYAELLANTVV
jgi:hypothetical protein